MNRNHFQLAMLAYNLNCWLMLFGREPRARGADAGFVPVKPAGAEVRVH